MAAYYNEIDPYAAAWLRNLISAGHIAPGDVDDRDIRDVRPSELRGYTQCHFFAGIGAWSYALRLAGWADDRPVWTGSCPCQPFSAAGGRGGFADERHLWPAWHHLIRECRPATVLGEQVASKDGLGWLDLVHADLEGEGYAVGAADLCAAGVGAPHIRQRAWFVAQSAEPGSQRRLAAGERPYAQLEATERGGAVGLVEDATRERLEGRPVTDRQLSAQPSRLFPARSGDDANFWPDADWIACRDGKARSVEPGTFPLAHGAPARVGRLRAYGNAIVPQVAAAFIGAVMDTAR